MNRFLQQLSSTTQFCFCKLIIIAFIGCLSSLTISAQNNLQQQLIGHWQLQKVSFKNMAADNSEKDRDQLLSVFKAALYEQLTDEQQSNLDDIEQINLEAELLLDKFYFTSIEFKNNGAFYNSSIDSEKSLSGEYLIDKKKLIMEWETADKNVFKILKITADKIVLKNIALKNTYYYTKTKIN